MLNRIKYSVLFLVIFFSCKIKINNNNSASILIHKQMFDTTVAVLTKFELPTNYTDGHWNILYINKKVKEDFCIKNNQINGLYKQYWPNGKVMYIGYFQDGIIRKEWNIYNYLGLLVKQFIYKHGVKHLEKTYNHNSKIEQIIYYDSDGITIKKIIQKKS